ncbi:unnamed protein product, partial [Choristocarpus tenellus]
VLVVEGNALVGIFTPRDMLNRVVAKGCSPDDTPVSEVMTPNPDSVTPDMTVMEALHEMHENRYLHLPVVNATGGVKGLVSVMDIVNAVAGTEGSSRWEAFFGSALDAGDDFSDMTSPRSVRMAGSTSAYGKARSFSQAMAADTSSISAAGAPKPKSSMEGLEEVRPVSCLRPRQPVVMPSSSLIIDVAIEMTGHKTDAALLVGEGGHLGGIITDNDLTR